MSRPKKIKPEEEIVVGPSQANVKPGPQPRDIVQTVREGHPFRARIGIVHTVSGANLVCYQPGRSGFPHRFNVDADDVEVVGKAKLHMANPLPEESPYADNNLDKI